MFVPFFFLISFSILPKCSALFYIRVCNHRCIICISYPRLCLSIKKKKTSSRIFEFYQDHLAIKVDVSGKIYRYLTLLFIFVYLLNQFSFLMKPIYSKYDFWIILKLFTNKFCLSVAINQLMLKFKYSLCLYSASYDD